MSTAVVLGGGISGLATAYYLRHVSRFSKILLLETSGRLGGWVNTTRHSDGAIYDHGPQTIRATGKPAENTISLIHELGLEQEVLPLTSSHPGANNRFIYYKNQIHALPTSIFQMFKKTPLVSHSLLRSILKDLVTKRAPQSEDETIHCFISRRFGTEVADVIVDSMCRGIYAGDIKELSLRACFPYLHKLEQDHRSIVLGSLKGKVEVDDSCPLVAKAMKEKWRLYAMKCGTQQLTDTIAEAIFNDPKCEIRLNTPCTKLELDAEKAMVHTEGGNTFQADHVFSALYAEKLKELLSEKDGPLYKHLDAIRAADVVVINLEFDGDVLPVQGFGHLLPSIESKHFLGVIYNSCMFPSHDRTGPPSTRFTIMIGGSGVDLNEVCPGMSDKSWTDLAVQSVCRQLRISANLRRSQVTISKKCIPQYTVGHTSRLEEMKAHIASHRLPLSLIGSSFEGAGINDCIYNAKLAVQVI